MSTQVDRAQSLERLHAAPEILRVVNVWDAVSARAVAALPETRAIATAGHSIAATYGYGDGQIPIDTMLDMVGRIVEAVGDLPVTADLDDGHGDAGETIRRAIGKGVVGANVEDRLKPLDESVAVVRAIVAAGVADAVERGRAYLDAGASLVFVPGVLDADVTRRLVDGIGERKVSVIGLPGSLTSTEYEALGVARISYGPMTQRVALTALQDLAADLYTGGVIPASTRSLN
jgi:2-methylisocitrate lyase-like PEP mutase family enzyme